MTTIEQAKQVERRLRKNHPDISLCKDFTEAADTIASLCAELEAAQRDAARYQWLRGEFFHDEIAGYWEHTATIDTGVSAIAHHFHGKAIPSLDECIDAAIAAGGDK
jgi:broad specificity phosphatase PhoE